jgi:hypothetical protein
MSKLGRYSAQRMKVETGLTSDKTVEVHDCGTIFVMNTSGGNLTITMPSATKAGAGWWCKVIRSDSNNILSINVSTNMANDAASLAGVGGGAGGDDGMETIIGDFAFSADSSKGAFAELYTDGVQWYCFALDGATTGITV